MPATVTEKQLLAFDCRSRARLTKHNVVATVVYLIQQVEQMQGLTGPEKKQLVLDTLTHLADDISDESNPRESQTKIFIEHAIKTILPGVIDALIEADKTGIHLNPRLKPKWWCCS